MEITMLSTTFILPRLPHLLGILLVAGAAIWGLTRPRKAVGALALVGAGLALLGWLEQCALDSSAASKTC